MHIKMLRLETIALLTNHELLEMKNNFVEIHDSIATKQWEYQIELKMFNSTTLIAED